MRSTTIAATALAVLLTATMSAVNAADEPATTEEHEHVQATPAQASKMDQQTKRMREMHEKMMAAKTPEERQALMADYMKSMQQGMAMMQQMHPKPGKGGMLRQMMEKRMDMMEMMMQMMMDQPGMGGMGMGGMGQNQ